MSASLFLTDLAIALAAVGASYLLWVLNCRTHARKKDLYDAACAYVDADSAQMHGYAQAIASTLGGQQYSYKFIPGVGFDASKFEIWIECRNAGQLCCRRERAGDTLGKRLRLVSEVQTGDESFDSAFFIDTTEPRFAERLLSIVGKRRALRDILTGGFDKLTLDDTRIVAEAATVTLFAQSTAALPLAALLKNLNELGSAQPQIAPHFGVALRRAWQARLTGLYGLLIALAGAGVTMLWHANEFFPCLDPGAVFADSLKYSVLAWLLWTGGILALMRGRSSGMRHLPIMTAAAALIFVVFAMAAILEINGVMDAGAATEREAVVIERYHRAVRSGPSHFAVVHSWRSGRNTERLPISATEYDRISSAPRNVVHVSTRPGYFEFEWLVSVAVGPAGPDAPGDGGHM